MYTLYCRSTPYLISGVSPAKQLFHSKFSTKLPQFDLYCDGNHGLHTCQNTDVEMKEKGKCYGNMKRIAVSNDVQVGDSVLLKLNAGDKFSSMNRSDPSDSIGRNKMEMSFSLKGSF